MIYTMEFKPRAIRDLKKIPKIDQRTIIGKIEGLGEKLTNHSPEYRLRIGDWRVLFEIDQMKWTGKTGQWNKVVLNH